MMQIGHYKIKGGIKDNRNYPIYAEAEDDKIKLQIKERKETGGVQDFAFKVTGIAGMNHVYSTETLTGFVGWRVPPIKIDEFLNTFHNFMYEKYKTFKMVVNKKKLKGVKILAKI